MNFLNELRWLTAKLPAYHTLNINYVKLKLSILKSSIINSNAIADAIATINEYDRYIANADTLRKAFNDLEFLLKELMNNIPAVEPSDTLQYAVKFHDEYSKRWNRHKVRLKAIAERPFPVKQVSAEKFHYNGSLPDLFQRYLYCTSTGRLLDIEIHASLRATHLYVPYWGLTYIFAELYALEYYRHTVVHLAGKQVKPDICIYKIPIEDNKKFINDWVVKATAKHTLKMLSK